MKNNSQDKKLVLKLANKILNSKRADGIILGCTELPIAVGEVKNRRILSSLEVLADNLVSEI